MKQILVVGSDPRISQDLDKHLDPKEFKLLVSPHGKSLFTSLTNVKPDLVILDLSQPDQGGTETMRKIRELDSGLPLIVLSKNPVHREKEKKEKNFTVLPPPVRMEQIAFMVEKVLCPQTPKERQKVLLGSVKLSGQKSGKIDNAGYGDRSEELVHSGNDDFQNVFEQTLSPIFKRIIKDYKGHIYDCLLSGLEKTMISEVLRHVNHNQVRASQLLGISRNTLRERMKRFDLY